MEDLVLLVPDTCILPIKDSVHSKIRSYRVFHCEGGSKFVFSLLISANTSIHSFRFFFSVHLMYLEIWFVSYLIYPLFLFIFMMQELSPTLVLSSCIRFLIVTSLFFFEGQISSFIDQMVLGFLSSLEYSMPLDL